MIPKSLILFVFLAIIPFTIGAQTYYWPVDTFPQNELEGFAPSYFDKARKALAINSVKYPDQIAAVQKIFEGPDGKYELTLQTLTETDGECLYEIWINDQKLVQFKNPTTSLDYLPVDHSIKDVQLNNQDLIRITFNNASNGKVPEGTSFAYARGRWTSLRIDTH